jgi:glutamine cyclotransferase
MRSPAFSRLTAFAAAMLLASGCAGTPSAAAPTATTAPTQPPASAAEPAAASVYPAPDANPDSQSVYPAPELGAAASAYPEPSAAASSPTTAPSQASAPASAEPSTSPSAPPAAPTQGQQADPATATAPPAGQQAAPPALSYTVVQTYTHDRTAYTQGLVYMGNDTFFEGTGLNGRSTLREVDLNTGEVRTFLPLDQEYFGEGIAVIGGRIFQLTWQSCKGFIYSYENNAFIKTGEFAYPQPCLELPVGEKMEGWGLTSDGTQLIMSDGTANLYFVDPEATASSGVLAITRQVEVRGPSGPIANLNELEYIDGEVWANIWQSDTIVRIDPASGAVTSSLDMSGLRSQLPGGGEVLNGIAYDEAGDRLFVTGKLWPLLFEIDLTSVVFLPVVDAA